jgi:hypothetical protein
MSARRKTIKGLSEDIQFRTEWTRLIFQSHDDKIRRLQLEVAEIRTELYTCLVALVIAVAIVMTYFHYK